MRFQKRVKHHSLLLMASVLVIALFYKIVPGDDPRYLGSMATAYTSLILLGITLAIGPLNLIQRRTNPVSTDLRRDIGIWTGVIGIIHVVIGIQVHMGNIWLYFVKALEGPNKLALREDLFGAANYIGLMATIILILLLLLSNDLSLKKLKPRRWKSLQQWCYFLFGFVVAHGILYQVIEKRGLSIVLFFVVVTVVTIVFQITGITRHKKHSTLPRNQEPEL